MLKFIHLQIFLFINLPYVLTIKQNVNILLVTDKSNNIVPKMVTATSKYLEKNSNLNIKIHLYVVQSLNSTKFLKSLCDILEIIHSDCAPFIVLDAVTLESLSEIVKYFTATLALPTIRVSFQQEQDFWIENEKQYFIYIKSLEDTVTDILQAFVIEQKISNVAILYDQHFKMHLRIKLKTILQNISTRHLFIEINFPNIEKQLKNLVKLEISNFFIFGSTDSIEKVLNTANDAGYLTPMYLWNGITLNSEQIKCNCTNTTILFANPKLRNESTFQDLKNDNFFNLKPEILTSFYFELLLQTVFTIKNMLKENAWPENLHFSTCNELNNTNKKLRRQNLNLRKYFTKNNLQSTIYGPLEITETGNHFMNFEMQISALYFYDNKIKTSTSLGVWTPVNKNIIITNSSPRIMQTFIENRFYKVVAVVQEPFVYKDNNSRHGVKGFCIDLLEEIANYCGFNYEIYLVPDEECGEINEKNEWNGMVRELIDKKADIAIGTISVNIERETVIDFTIPFYKSVGISALMKKPIQSRSLFKFLFVLDNDVWLCILVACCFASFIIWIFDRWSPCSYQNNVLKYQNSKEKRLFTFKECLWFCIISLTLQGGGEAPKNTSGRLVAATWWLFGFIIISSYTANLGVFLITPKLNNPISSINDLSKQYKISYAPRNNSFIMKYFLNMVRIEKMFSDIWENMILNESLSNSGSLKLSVWEYPVSTKYTKMWEQIVQTELPVTEKEAIERVRNSESENEGFAYFSETSYLEYLVLTNCDLEILDDEIYKRPYSIGVQKNSVLKNEINNAILDLMNKKKLIALKNKWWTENPDIEICDARDLLVHGIKIHNIGGFFIIIFVAILLVYITRQVNNKYKFRTLFALCNKRKYPKKYHKQYIP